MPTLELGSVDLPSGIALLVDPGLLVYWCHDNAPVSPNPADPALVDLFVDGPDGAAAGAAFPASQGHPRYLFDLPSPAPVQEAFSVWAEANGHDARLIEVQPRFGHRERIDVVVRSGKQQLLLAGRQAALLGPVPPGTYTVRGTTLDTGEFAGAWDHIDLVLAEGEVARTERVAEVRVEHGRFYFVDANAVGSFQARKTLDGLADYAFWGPDAAELAEQVGAARLSETEYGWRDLPVQTIGQLATSLQAELQHTPRRVRVDFRPHTHLGQLHDIVRGTPEGKAQLRVGGATTLALDTRWGPGTYEAQLCWDAEGTLLGLRIQAATAARERDTRRLLLARKLAIVSKRIAQDRAPVGLITRDPPRNEHDSGWAFYAGDESPEYQDDAQNFVLVPIHNVADEALLQVIDAAPGSSFVREGGGFRPLPGSDQTRA